MPIHVEGEHALGPDHVLGLLSIREGILNVDAIVLFNLVKQLIRLWVQASSVQAASGRQQFRTPSSVYILTAQFAQRHCLNTL